MSTTRATTVTRCTTFPPGNNCVAAPTWNAALDTGPALTVSAVTTATIAVPSFTACSSTQVVAVTFDAPAGCTFSVVQGNRVRRTTNSQGNNCRDNQDADCAAGGGATTATATFTAPGGGSGTNSDRYYRAFQLVLVCV